MCPQSIDRVRYIAAPGERNQVTVAPIVYGMAWTFSDPGAVITVTTPADLCWAIDEHTVRCAPRPFPDGTGVLRSLFVAIDVGDLDDQVAAGGMVIHGGPGNDRLTGNDPTAGIGLYGDEGDDVLSSRAAGGRLDGGPGDDRLVGGDGYDELVGGGGVDTLDGGGSGDLLVDGDVDGVDGPAGPGPDRLVGGSGKDEVSYRTRSAAVRVDLAGHASAGEPGEGDVLSSVENLTGGRGDDRLSGNDAANRLSGGRGRDRLIGRGGNDTLVADRGPGSISCGSERDVVFARMRSPNTLAADCELVAASDYIDGYPASGPSLLTAYPRAIDHRRLRYRAWCPPDESDGEPVGTGPCAGRLRIREASGRRRLLASAAFPSGMWRHRVVDARLTGLGRRLAERPPGVRATATLELQQYGEEPRSRVVKWTTRLRIPR